MSRREFYGVEFYAFCQQEYDKARAHLKNCGKPNDVKTSQKTVWKKKVDYFRLSRVNLEVKND